MALLFCDLDEKNPAIRKHGWRDPDCRYRAFSSIIEQ